MCCGCRIWVDISVLGHGNHSGTLDHHEVLETLRGCSVGRATV